MIRAVTFDFWNTLVHEDGSSLRDARHEGIRRVLRDAGHEVDVGTLEDLGRRAWNIFATHWQPNRQYTYRDALEEMLASLGIEPSPAVRADLEQVFLDAPREAVLRTADGIEDCLSVLKSAGVRLGIVCDVGMTPSFVLRERLDGWGLLGYFDHWSFSDDVGWYKPAREIFEHALAGLGSPEPGRAAHVGDLRWTDVAGARAMGMVSVRYAGLHGDTDEAYPDADHVVTSHAEIPAALGVG